jgi:putative hydrolase of the HAD superfamily
MSEVSILVFDLGNVLLPFSYENMYARLEAVESGLGRRFKDFYAANYIAIHRRYERGGISDEEFITPILDTLDHKISRELFCSLFSKIFVENEPVTALLPALKRRYRLFLLSNTSKIHRMYGWNDYAFLSHFEKLFLSYELHALKPEPKIYQAVMNYTKAAPEEHLFIDDVLEYVEGARTIGWAGIHYTEYAHFIRDLKSNNILLD